MPKRSLTILLVAAALMVSALSLCGQTIVTSVSSPQDQVQALKTSLPGASSSVVNGNQVVPPPAAPVVLAVGEKAARGAVDAGAQNIVITHFSDLKSTGMNGKCAGIGVTSDLTQTLSFLKKAFGNPTVGLLHTSRNDSEFLSRFLAASQSTGLVQTTFLADKLSAVGAGLGYLKETNVDIILLAPDPLFSQRDVKSLLIRFSTEKRVRLISLDPGNRGAKLYGVLVPAPTATANLAKQMAEQIAAGTPASQIGEMGPGEYQLIFDARLSKLVKPKVERAYSGSVKTE